MEMWTRFSSDAGLIVGLDDLCDLSNLNDSMRVYAYWLQRLDLQEKKKM